MEIMTTLIAVRDIEKSKHFYTGLLGMVVTHDLGVNVTLDDRLSLQTLESWAGFTDSDPDDIRFGGGEFELYFEEEDFDAFLERMAGWEVAKVHDVKEFPWGQRVIRIYDPDMHYVEVGESMRVVVGRMLLDGMTDEQAQEKSQFPLEFVQACRRALQEQGKL